MISLKDTFVGLYNSINFENITDHPNILIAANFWEMERFEAAKTCYRFMRAIDDLIDDHKASGKRMSPEEKKMFAEEVDKWLRMVIEGESHHPLQGELTSVISQFRIPAWPLEAFARSMIYDINNDGFSTIETFIDYAGGASVAPAAIFVHLAGLRKENGIFYEPSFNVREAAISCAIFSYLVHIIRDFQKDQLNHLNYFADDLISGNGLTRAALYEIARGEDIPSGFRNMMAEYYRQADYYRLRTIECINEIWQFLEPRYQLSLEIIFELYLMVFERIDIENGRFTASELTPTPLQAGERVLNTIINSRTLKY